jgi:hypothetical protein
MNRNPTGARRRLIEWNIKQLREYGLGSAGFQDGTLLAFDFRLAGVAHEHEIVIVRRISGRIQMGINGVSGRSNGPFHESEPEGLPSTESPIGLINLNRTRRKVDLLSFK